MIKCRRLDPRKQQLGDAIKSELDLMTQVGVLGEVIAAGIDSTGMKACMQRHNISLDLMFMTKLSSGNHSFKVLLDGQPSYTTCVQK